MTPYYVAAVWTGYDIPAGSIYTLDRVFSCLTWRHIMQKVHEGLEYRTFTDPTSIGGDTMIFGDLTEPTPSPTPEPTEPPEETEPAGTLPPDDPEDWAA